MGKLARIALWVMLLLPALLHAQQVVQTPNIGLQTPAYGAEYWNVPLNYNFTQLDLYLSGNLALPGLSVTGYASMPGLTTWNKNTSYSINNVVSYQGTFYASLVNGNQGNTPSNGSYWSSSVGSSTPPGGANQDVQFNSTGVFGGDPTFTFNTSTKFLGVQNEFVNPLGSAITGTNYGSGQLEFSGSYCTGSPCNPALDEWNFQSYMGTGANPTSELLINHTGTSGTSFVQFANPVFLTGGGTSTTQSPGDNSTKIATDAFVLANAGGNPGGANTQVQFNNSGVFGGNSALTFNPSTANLTIGSPSPSTFGDAGLLSFTAPYNTGSGTALDLYQMYIQIGSGVNPFSNLVINHTSGSPGGGEIYLAVPTYFAYGAVVQGGLLQVDSLTPSAGAVCTDGSSNLTTSGCSSGGGGGVTPKNYGGYGDALQIPNGCTTTVSSASVTCLGADFGSGDVGKELWVSGAGAAGVAYGAAITAVTSSTVVTLASTASTAVTAAYAVYGHDDVVAIQDCINASSLGGTTCVLGTATPNLFLTGAGYLVASAGLQIPTHANFTGSSYYGGTTIFSEYNGDLFSLTTGTSSLYAGQPVSGVTMSNLDLVHDPSQPAGRGIHLNSAAGLYGFGGMYYTTFNSISDENAALECLWMDGHTNGNNNPNQYITFNNLVCNGPNQMHTANEIKITGIQAQILFLNGAINGLTQSNYPNPLIYIGEKTTGQGDSPGAVKFLGFTYEVGTQGLYVGNGALNIHFDDGYIEQVESPLIVAQSVEGLTFRGNHIANSGNIGAVAQFSNSNSSTITATLQDNFVYGSSPAPAAFAVCTGGTNNFAIDFLNNSASPLSNSMSTSDCATNHIGSGAALLQPQGVTATVDASSQVINLIEDPYVQPGKTLTLYALSGGAGSFSLASGGTPTANEYPINLGALSSPLVVTAGNTVILALMDQGSFEWTVVGGTAVTGTGVSSIGVTTANGVSGTSSGGSTPSLTLALGAITPSSVIASGIVDGQAPVTITTGSTATLGGTYSSGYTINHEGTAATAVTYTLPTAAAGKQYCVKNGNNGSAADTGVLTLQTSAAGQSIVYNGTAGASDGYLVSGGAAGDAACVVGISSTQWEAYAQVGTWTVH